MSICLCLLTFDCYASVTVSVTMTINTKNRQETVEYTCLSKDITETSVPIQKHYHPKGGSIAAALIAKVKGTATC